MKIQFKFRKERIIPNPLEYSLVLVSSALVFFFLKGVLLQLFPSLNNLNPFWSFFILTAIIIYLEELFTLKIGNNHVFGNGN